ncbi:acyltransferase family protein [Desulfovibrio psychrotolerans]|uniref:Acyltransferase n=1 Tax=Desulfovibrio psychrotolerans TaxID=415242 RepID=A0A7J0BUB8_9BACT|nr:acyltransferase [Desulfovibrio psychrotolerans]GFM37310.1 acyltransferase [Desulfovibrio psychrotolerans]
MRKEFLNYINNFRGIAILYIVLGHCLSAFDWSANRVVADVVHVVFTNGTVLFVFIAGYLFQYLSYKYNYGKYLKSKFLNVGMPYVIMSVPGVLYFTLFAQRAGMEYVNEWPWLLRVVEFYLVGAQLVPFWFIPMIFIHFFLSPFYIHGDRRGWLYYLLPLFFIIGLFVWRGGPYQLQSYLHYAFVYFFGMFLCRYRERFNPILSRGDVLLLLFFTVTALGLLEYGSDFQSMYAKRLNFVQHIVQCPFYIGLLVRFEHVIGKRMDLFATMSFGIFFVHSYLISVFKLVVNRAGGGATEGSVFLLMLFYAAILGTSMLFVMSVKRIFGKHSRMVCGS